MSGQDLDKTLDERGARYGEFDGHAYLTQGVKSLMRSHPGWNRLGPHHREALDMIAHKVGRIVNGDPDYADSWVDVAGYAQLVVREIGKKAGCSMTNKEARG